MTSSPSDLTPEPTPEPTPARFGLMKRAGMLLIPVTLVAVAWGVPTEYARRTRARPVEVTVAHPPADGAALFAANCAYCHGPNGEGNGVAALTTKARDFGAEPFKFTKTTGTKVPTDAELMATLHRGIEGSSMPSFADLRPDEREALVRHVRQLARHGLYAQLLKKALADYDNGGDDVNPARVEELAEEKSKVGEPLAIPAAFKPDTPESVAAGKAVFQGSCASCHGPEGKGDGPQTKDPRFVNENGTKAVPRNLTTGVYKGGGAKADLYARVRLGIPGTPMPAGTTLTEEQTQDLVTYILSLARDDKPAPTQTAGR
jgi:cytochrome c oxidase cbb3-type subunit I/II